MMSGWCGGDKGLVPMGEGVCLPAEVRGLMGWCGAWNVELDGVPKGSPLSLVLFLVWMVPIRVEMERRIRKEVPGVGVKFPSYVDDLPCGCMMSVCPVGGCRRWRTWGRWRTWSTESQWSLRRWRLGMVSPWRRIKRSN